MRDREPGEALKNYDRRKPPPVKLVPDGTVKRALPLRLLPAAMIALLSALALTLPALGAGALSLHAHTAARFKTGIGDEQPEMFTDPLWQQLHTKIARLTVP